MSRARGLFLAAAGAAILAIAYAVARQGGANPDPSHQGAASGAPTARAAAPPRSLATASPPEVVMLAPRVALGSSQTRPAPSSDHLPLALQLQRELARVGCYDGVINGVWTVATRRALKAFVDRVNATLPTDAPDQIQLALVRAAPDRVCGVACPPGQSLADGRCIPDVILAGKKFAPMPQGDAQQADPGSERPAWSLSSRAATGINTPGEVPAAAAPGTVRSAAARRQRPQSPFFGFSIIRQFKKLGF